MHWQLWLGFVAASALIGLTPGPAVLAIVGYALNGGRRTALASVAGTAIGNTIAMSLSLAGAGVVLAASAWAFAALKWAGASYLIVLGLLALWKSRQLGKGMPASTRPISPRTAFLNNIAVGIFHPKTIVFFVAFVPQFIDAEAPISDRRRASWRRSSWSWPERTAPTPCWPHGRHISSAGPALQPGCSVSAAVRSSLPAQPPHWRIDTHGRSAFPRTANLRVCGRLQPPGPSGLAGSALGLDPR